MIVLQDISKSYGHVTAVRHVDLSISKGSIFGIIGRSGAGKSSLLRTMSLLETPDSGEVIYNGERVDTLRGMALLERRRKMGMIFQNFNLLGSRDVMENIAYPMEIAGYNRKQIEARVDELLEMVDIADKRKARMSELSGGQKQRVAIARALAVNPQILFCDEATSALDPQTTRSILALIHDLHKTLKITVVLITHQMGVIKQICQEVAVMDKGTIVETGEAASVFNSPKATETWDLLHG